MHCNALHSCASYSAGCEVVDRVKGSGCKAFFTGYNMVEDLITHTLLVEGDAKEIIESLRNSGLRVYSAKTGSDKTLVIVSKKPCHLCRIPYHGVNYTVLHHTVDDRGRAVVRIAAARSKTIENLVKMLDEMVQRRSLGDKVAAYGS